MKRIKKVSLCFLSILSVVGLVACGSSKAESTSSVTANYKSDYATDVMMESVMDNGFAEAGYSYDSGNTKAEILNDSARKLIKSYTLDVETENISALMASLQSKIAALSGYIEDMNTYYGSSKYSSGSKYCNLTARIPVQYLETFVSFVGDAANVTSENLGVQDVTLQYVDTNSRKATYEIEQERLLALLEKAESIEDIITIESRLSDVRYQLESMASQLRTYDNLVDYATVYVHAGEVTEFTEPEPETYGERISRAFKDGFKNCVEGLKNFSIRLVEALPTLFVIAIIAVALIFIIKAFRKSYGKRNCGKKNKKTKDVNNIVSEKDAE